MKAGCFPSYCVVQRNTSGEDRKGNAVFLLSSLYSDWFLFRHRAKIPLHDDNAAVRVGQQFCLHSRGSHRCFSFCVWSPLPAWQCSPCGTSSCACQACTRWPRRTPAPPWPAEHTTHTHTHAKRVSSAERLCWSDPASLAG